MMKQSPFSALSLLLLLVVSVAAVAASRPVIPYDGQQVHVGSQYREHHSTFEHRAHHNNRHQLHHRSYHHSYHVNEKTLFDPEKDAFVVKGHGEMKSHHEYPADQVLISMQTDPEHILQKKHSTIATESSSEDSNNFQDAFVMFLICTLDNLFWLVPFVAHSPMNAVWFIATYQTLVVASCLLFTPEASIASAHALNNLYGISGAIFCWVLAYCFHVQFQKRFHRQVATSLLKTSNNEDYEEQDIELTSLERPLLISSRQSHSNSINNTTAASPDTVPPAWLVIAMTIVAAVDDIFYIPTMVQTTQLFTVSTMFLASFQAVMLWSTVAILLAATTRFRRVLIKAPLYMILATYAAVMTGHALFDFWSLGGAASWNTLRNLNVLHVSRKLH